MAKKQQKGFAIMSKSEHRRIASLGGKAAQASGRAYRFTSETAQIAGKKGGKGRGKKLKIS